MDTENLNKWWYSLPEEIRKKLYVQENINVWKDLDMSTRVAMFRYCRMKIFGIGKNGDMERSLLIETVCGLADIALVKRSGIALEDMCDDEGNFLEEYQKQFNTVYDRYEAVLANMDWTNCCTDMEISVREIIEHLEKTGYSRVDIDTDRRTAKTFSPTVAGFISTVRETCHSISYLHRTVSDWDGLQYAPPVTGKAHSWGQTKPRSFSGGCLPSSKVREKRMR